MKKYELVKRELMAVERTAWWNPRVRRILKAAPLVVLFLLLNTRGARAACSFNPTPDPTVDGSANSLRAAVQAANASGQDCVIELQAGTYTLTIKNTNGQENNAAEGDLDITDSGHTVTIKGQGAKASIVNGGGVNGISDRVFQVLGEANAIFKKLTIEGGVANDDGMAGAQPGSTESDGGGLLVQDGGHVTLSHVWIEGNQALGAAGSETTCISGTCSGRPGQAAAGGALFLSTGTVDLVHSKMSGNAAAAGQGGNAFSSAGGPGGAGSGGGFYVLSGSARLLRSMVSDNSANGGVGGSGGLYDEIALPGGPGGQGAGGGLYVVSGSTWLVKSEVSDNHAAGGLGGRAKFAIAGIGRGGGAGGAAQGGGLFVGASAFTVRQTTVSGNSTTGGKGGFDYAEYISGFQARGGSSQGAGMFVASGRISLANSTLFANQAKGGSGGCNGENNSSICSSPSSRGQGGDAAGGGLYVSTGSISLTGDTVASNQALIGLELTPPGTSSGGGIANAGATNLVANTTLIANNTQDSGNTNNGDDVSGEITSSSSLFGQIAGTMITDHGGNIFDQDPLLDPGGLKFNGGPTQTVALQIGSPAIDTGANAVCSAPPPTGLGGVDQRGYTRFPHGDNLCDIGAFEFYNLLVHPKFEYFAPQTVGRQSQSRSLFITNNQMTGVTLSAIIGGREAADFIESNNCGATLAANASCIISIAFKPAATGEHRAVLRVSDSPDRTSPYTIELTGEGK